MDIAFEFINSSFNIFWTFKVMKQSSMNCYSRISGMFERIKSIIDGANLYIYARLPRHTILIVYSIQKF